MRSPTWNPLKLRIFLRAMNKIMDDTFIYETVGDECVSAAGSSTSSELCSLEAQNTNLCIILTLLFFCISAVRHRFATRQVP